MRTRLAFGLFLLLGATAGFAAPRRTPAVSVTMKDGSAVPNPIVINAPAGINPSPVIVTLQNTGSPKMDWTAAVAPAVGEPVVLAGQEDPKLVDAAVYKVAGRVPEPAKDGAEYLTRAQIAERYDRSPRTVDDWCRAADWPAGRRRGRVMEYRAELVDAAVRRRGHE